MNGALAAAGAGRRHRLRGAAAFARIFRSGRRIETSRFQLIAVPAAEPGGRIGYVIGAKHLPRAVDRNRLRRLLREAWRARREVLSGFDIVLRLREVCVAADLPAVAAEATSLFEALGGARAP